MNLILSLLLAVATLHRSSSAIGYSPNATTVECDEGKTNCSECYITLVKSLMYSDGNVYNLSRAFLPPNGKKPRPVFVRVNYHFVSGGETSTESEKVAISTWFWTLDSSALVHPLEGFQYFSLLFGDHNFRVGEAKVTLPTECANASEGFFELLTQRLQVHTSQPESITPSFPDDILEAKSVSMDGLKTSYKEQATTLLAMQLSLPPLTAVVAWFVLKSLHKKIDKFLPRNKLEQNASVFSIVTLSIIFVCFALIMDSIGVYYSMRKLPIAVSTLPNDTFNTVLAHIHGPGLIAYDLIALVVYVAFVVSVRRCLCCVTDQGICKCLSYDEWRYNDPSKQIWRKSFIIADALVLVIFVISNHSYYTILAFVDDPIHANSISIYYIVTLIVYLILLKLLWSEIISKFYNKVKTKRVYRRVQEGEQTGSEIQYEHIKCCDLVVIIYVSFCILALFVVFQVLVTIAIFRIPTTQPIEDVPTQLYSIYESIFIVIGTLITYNFLIKRQSADKLESILQKGLIAFAKSKKDKINPRPENPEGSIQAPETQDFDDNRLAMEVVRDLLIENYKDPQPNRRRDVEGI